MTESKSLADIARFVNEKFPARVNAGLVPIRIPKTKSRPASDGTTNLLIDAYAHAGIAGKQKVDRFPAGVEKSDVQIAKGDVSAAIAIALLRTFWRDANKVVLLPKLPFYARELAALILGRIATDDEIKALAGYFPIVNASTGMGAIILDLGGRNSSLKGIMNESRTRKLLDSAVALMNRKGVLTQDEVMSVHDFGESFSSSSVGELPTAAAQALDDDDDDDEIDIADLGQGEPNDDDDDDDAEITPSMTAAPLTPAVLQTDQAVNVKKVLEQVKAGDAADAAAASASSSGFFGGAGSLLQKAGSAAYTVGSVAVSAGSAAYKLAKGAPVSGKYAKLLAEAKNPSDPKATLDAIENIILVLRNTVGTKPDLENQRITDLYALQTSAESLKQHIKDTASKAAQIEATQKAEAALKAQMLAEEAKKLANEEAALLAIKENTAAAGIQRAYRGLLARRELKKLKEVRDNERLVALEQERLALEQTAREQAAKANPTSILKPSNATPGPTAKQVKFAETVAAAKAAIEVHVAAKQAVEQAASPREIAILNRALEEYLTNGHNFDKLELQKEILKVVNEAPLAIQSSGNQELDDDARVALVLLYSNAAVKHNMDINDHKQFNIRLLKTLNSVFTPAPSNDDLAVASFISAYLFSARIVFVHNLIDEFNAGKLTENQLFGYIGGRGIAENNLLDQGQRNQIIIRGSPLIIERLMASNAKNPPTGPASALANVFVTSPLPSTPVQAASTDDDDDNNSSPVTGERGPGPIDEEDQLLTEYIQAATLVVLQRAGYADFLNQGDARGVTSRQISDALEWASWFVLIDYQSREAAFLAAVFWKRTPADLARLYLEAYESGEVNPLPNNMEDIRKEGLSDSAALAIIESTKNALITLSPRPTPVKQIRARQAARIEGLSNTPENCITGIPASVEQLQVVFENLFFARFQAVGNDSDARIQGILNQFKDLTAEHPFCIFVAALYYNTSPESVFNAGRAVGFVAAKVKAAVGSQPAAFGSDTQGAVQRYWKVVCNFYEVCKLLGTDRVEAFYRSLAEFNKQFSAAIKAPSGTGGAAAQAANVTWKIGTLTKQNREVVIVYSDDAQLVNSYYCTAVGSSATKKTPVKLGAAQRRQVVLDATPVQVSTPCMSAADRKKTATSASAAGKAAAAGAPVSPNVTVAYQVGTLKVDKRTVKVYRDGMDGVLYYCTGTAGERRRQKLGIKQMPLMVPLNPIQALAKLPCPTAAQKRQVAAARKSAAAPSKAQKAPKAAAVPVDPNAVVAYQVGTLKVDKRTVKVYSDGTGGVPYYCTGTAGERRRQKLGVKQAPDVVQLNPPLPLTKYPCPTLKQKREMDAARKAQSAAKKATAAPKAPRAAAGPARVAVKRGVTVTSYDAANIPVQYQVNNNDPRYSTLYKVDAVGGATNRDIVKALKKDIPAFYVPPGKTASYGRQLRVDFKNLKAPAFSHTAAGKPRFDALKGDQYYVALDRTSKYGKPGKPVSGLL